MSILPFRGLGSWVPGVFKLKLIAVIGQPDGQNRAPDLETTGVMLFGDSNSDSDPSLPLDLHAPYYIYHVIIVRVHFAIEAIKPLNRLWQIPASMS